MSEKYLISKEDLEKILIKFEDYSISPETIKLFLKKAGPFLNKKEEKKSIDELANEICEKLPEDYEIIIHLRKGSCGVELELPRVDDGYFYSVSSEDTLEKIVYKALNDACYNDYEMRGNTLP